MDLSPILGMVIAAWKKNQGQIRAVIIVASLLALGSAGAFLAGAKAIEQKQLLENLGATLAAIAALIFVAVAKYQSLEDESKQKEKIEQAENKAASKPNEPQLAWDLARLKLESYLNRNLAQIQSIFWLTAIVMTVGFLLIGFGIYKSFESPDNLHSSVIAAGSGILINFIGATFLILYKSTLGQSTDYVRILERINAVGMSVQILATLDPKDAANLKQQTTADIAKQLVALYGRETTSTAKTTSTIHAHG